VDIKITQNIVNNKNKILPIDEIDVKLFKKLNDFALFGIGALLLSIKSKIK
jgi:hypothetical protein